MPEREVERQRAGGDRVDAHLRALVAHAHDGALAELALDLRERALQRGVAGLGGLLLFGGHAVGGPLWLALREQCSVDGPIGRNPTVRVFVSRLYARSRRNRGATRAMRATRPAARARAARSATVRARPGASGRASPPRRRRRPAAPRAASSIRRRRSRRTRATVTCGRNGRRLGLRTAARRPARSTTAACSAASTPRRPRAHREHVRAARRPATAASPSAQHRRRRAGHAAHGLACAGRPRRARDGRGSASVTCSASSRDGAQRARSSRGGRAPEARQAGARRRPGSSSGGEEPRAHARPLRSAARRRSPPQQPPHQVHGDRGRAVADVGAARRAAARERVDAPPVRARRREAHEADRLLLASRRPGPAMPVMPDADVGVRARARAPSASASATSSETAPCALDQRRDRRPRARTFASLE